MKSQDMVHGTTPSTHDHDKFWPTEEDANEVDAVSEYDYETIPAEGLLDAHGHWFTSSEDCLAEQDAFLADGDEEYEMVLITFNEAKEALRHARVAR